jgi:RNA polymerase sigma-70 factor (ECF subfamily)
MKYQKREKEAAFEIIVSQYEAQLLRYVSRMVYNFDLAEDVVQETFIKLFKKWKEELVPSPQISSWLYRVAHNKAIDMIRKENRRINHQNHKAEFDKIDLEMFNKGDKEISSKALDAAKILNSLTPEEKQLVILKVYEKKSYKEISEITNLSTGNIGFKLHHIMKKMAKKLKGENK